MDDSLPSGAAGAPSAPRFPINIFKSTAAKVPHVSGHATVEQIAERMRKVLRTASKEAAPLVTFAQYRAGADSRAVADIAAVHAVYGDIDKGFDANAFDAGLAELAQTGAPIIAHQTYRHKPEAPRWRVFVFLDEPILPALYRACWDGLNAVFGGMLDGNAKDAARLNYWPSCPPGEAREVRAFNIEAAE